ncbi:MAG: protein serine/threonine phosphatase 2C family protein [Parcubacteria group bacterium]|nr:protein serine/threonine phosphatase 2C family protein [Parcubacteria group bacterium]
MSHLTSIRALGERDHQEDRYCITPVRTAHIEGYLLAVFDGHGGDAVSEYCRKHFQTFFIALLTKSIATALAEATARIAQETAHYQCGSTLSAAFVCESNDTVTVAVLGDSPVLVCKENGSVLIAPQHNVHTNIVERYACIERGAAYSCGYIGAPNSNPMLQLSRALGDAELRSVISDVPEIFTLKSPRAVVVATDGIDVDPYDTETHTGIAEIMQGATHAKTILEWRQRRGILHDNTTILLWRAER